MIVTITAELTRLEGPPVDKRQLADAIEAELPMMVAAGNSNYELDNVMVDVNAD